VAVEHSGYPLGECVDVVVDIFWRTEREKGKGFAGDLGVEKVREFIPVGPAEVTALARHAMFERDGKDTRYERVVRAMTRESLALLQKRPEGRLRDKYKVNGRRGVVDWGEEGGGACLDALGEAVSGHNVDEERRVRAGSALRVERARP
jgi:hypothetical protein